MNKSVKIITGIIAMAIGIYLLVQTVLKFKDNSFSFEGMHISEFGSVIGSAICGIGFVVAALIMFFIKSKNNNQN